MKPGSNLVALLLLGPVWALAHHSGLYDENDVIELAGTITRIDWINPHVRLIVETADGRAWEVEGTSVNALERWGFSREQFNVGDAIRLQGPRSRFGRDAMIGATARINDGELLFLWPNIASRLGLADTGVSGLFPAPAAPAEQAGRGIFRVWTPRGRPGRPELELTDAAREALAAYNPLDDDPALRCIPPGMPVMLDTPYPVEFVDRGDEILMRFEEWDGLRTVYLAPGAGPAVSEHSPRGVSDAGRAQRSPSSRPTSTTRISTISARRRAPT